METTSITVNRKSPRKRLSKQTQTIQLSPPPQRSQTDKTKPLFTLPNSQSDPPSLSAPHTLPSTSSQQHPNQYSTAERCAARASSGNTNAARERSRVRTLRLAFLELQRTLPAVPRDTKLSKLDVLLLASAYIAQLTATLSTEGKESNTVEHVDQLHSEHSSSKTILLKHHHHHHHHQQQQQQQQHSGTRDSPALSTPKIQEQFCRRNEDGESGTDEHTVARKGNDHAGCYPEGQAEKLPVVSGLRTPGYLHPVRKWPMRARLYAGIMASASGVKAKKATSKMSLE